MLIGVITIHWQSGTNGLDGKPVPPGDYYVIIDAMGRLLHMDGSWSLDKCGVAMWRATRQLAAEKEAHEATSRELKKFLLEPPRSGLQFTIESLQKDLANAIERENTATKAAAKYREERDLAAGLLESAQKSRDEALAIANDEARATDESIKDKNQELAAANTRIAFLDKCIHDLGDEHDKCRNALVSTSEVLSNERAKLAKVKAAWEDVKEYFIDPEDINCKGVTDMDEAMR